MSHLWRPFGIYLGDAHCCKCTFLRILLREKPLRLKIDLACHLFKVLPDSLSRVVESEVKCPTPNYPKFPTLPPTFSEFPTPTPTP